MTARYNSSDNTLKEISQIEKPVEPDDSLYPGLTYEFISDQYHYEANLKIYEDHIASLRTLPCHESCRGLWKEGDVLEERKDYGVRGVCGFDENDNAIPPRDTAFPLVPVKSEDELWLQAIHYLRNNPALSDNTKVADLKTMFTITRKP